ncbi:hypothetical protein [Hugenholtzia roseola]|uniref:hypothetical protein n=1 Tax=Hugenholtzia roseola TaxID=1002 RepID=UPI00054EFFE6|nr:hypothetical protein [Hugenholtzia roseola]
MFIQIMVTLLVLGLFFALMAVRLVAKKDGEFRGTCASQNPFLKREGESCSYCGKSVSDCPNK